MAPVFGKLVHSYFAVFFDLESRQIIFQIKVSNRHGLYVICHTPLFVWCVGLCENVMVTLVLLLVMAACIIKLCYCSTFPSAITIGVAGCPQCQYRMHGVTNQIEL